MILGQEQALGTKSFDLFLQAAHYWGLEVRLLGEHGDWVKSWIIIVIRGFLADCHSWNPQVSLPQYLLEPFSYTLVVIMVPPPALLDVEPRALARTKSKALLHSHTTAVNIPGVVWHALLAPRIQPEVVGEQSIVWLFLMTRRPVEEQSGSIVRVSISKRKYVQELAGLENHLVRVPIPFCMLTIIEEMPTIPVIFLLTNEVFVYLAKILQRAAVGVLIGIIPMPGRSCRVQLSLFGLGDPDPPKLGDETTHHHSAAFGFFRRPCDHSMLPPRPGLLGIALVDAFILEDGKGWAVSACSKALLPTHSIDGRPHLRISEFINPILYHARWLGSLRPRATLPSVDRVGRYPPVIKPLAPRLVLGHVPIYF
mmetsp:Transcript_47289/g.69102  ORF Transcript_47289/g.69102 Transcript_47289/m.69102 type:complete len:368 (+) Transcript_47289:320-1423(+)